MRWLIFLAFESTIFVIITVLVGIFGIQMFNSVVFEPTMTTNAMTTLGQINPILQNTISVIPILLSVSILLAFLFGFNSRSRKPSYHAEEKAVDISKQQKSITKQLEIQDNPLVRKN